LGIWNLLIGWVEQLLRILYGVTHNYGLAIILLTILIRIVLYPLMKKQMISMQETQKIQPLMQEIQKKYKDDKERMNQEVMRLYKEHGVNPMGGCLPLLIQMPILILFFRVLREFDYKIPDGTIDAAFLWIKNLAEPDKLFGIIGGYSIGILPILVGVSMFFQQKLTMPPMPVASQGNSSSNPAASTQKMMGTIMPVMIAFISFSLPSGLSLYWFTSTLFDIVQKLIINRKDPEIKKEHEDPKAKEKEEKIQEQRREPEIRKKESKQDLSWIPGYEKPAKKPKKDR
jgi:YidC/Oxa1 family membrane protein insertase